MSVPQPLPRVAAFEKLGFGMFIHWGLYSQLGEGEWTLNHRLMFSKNITREEYYALQNTFTACDFDARKLAATAKAAGMNYIVLTSRHHEGFSLYDTCGLNDFDAPHSPARRDLIKEFVEACREYDLKPFLYHTTIDWHWHDKRTRDLSEEEFQEYLLYLHQSVEILCKNYGPLGGLWFDGNWARPKSDWHEDRLYGIIRKYQPDAIIVNNTGLSALGKLGHPEIDSVTYENSVAKPMNREGHSKYVSAEVCRTMNSHWGNAKNDLNYMAPKEIIKLLVHSRGCGANLLLNIGPTAQGGIPEYEAAALNVVGRWVATHGEAIYDPRPIPSVKCHGDDIILKDGKNYYYFVIDLGIQGDPNVVSMNKGCGTRSIDYFPDEVVSAEWMDSGEQLKFMQDKASQMLSLHCTGFSYGHNTVIRVAKITTR